MVTIPVALIGFFQWGWGNDFIILMVAYGIIQALDGNVLVPLLFSEAVNLRTDEVHLESGAFRVTGKRGKVRIVPIPQYTMPWWSQGSAMLNRVDSWPPCREELEVKQATGLSISAPEVQRPPV